MGNQVALGALARPGDEVVCESGAHFLHYEGGSVAAHLGLMMRPLPGVNGVIVPEQVEAAIRPGSEHFPRTAVVAIENTHNAAGGRIFPLEVAEQISAVARERGAAVHIDGARIFNAEAATGTPVAAWAACADTITFCFSKGLGAPVGSMVCGSKEVIKESHRLRKRLGGGMRQVGVLAAAARVALEDGRKRLGDDHANARVLAQGLLELEATAVDIDSVETNMVYLNLRAFGKTGPEVAAGLREEGILTLGVAEHSMRLVTHRDVSEMDVKDALEGFKKVLLG